YNHRELWNDDHRAQYHASLALTPPSLFLPSEVVLPDRALPIIIVSARRFVLIGDSLPAADTGAKVHRHYQHFALHLTVENFQIRRNPELRIAGRLHYIKRCSAYRY